MLILLGKTASGKDSIVKKLVDEYGYNRIVTYTSRPIRDGEIDGKDYHFITKEAFLDKIDKKDFMEYKIYHTVFDDWYYGSAKKDFINANKRTVVILTPDGYKDFLKCVSIPHVSILIQSNRFVTKRRLIKRGDNKEEANRRLKHDNVDFMGCEDLVDYVISNNGFDEHSLDNVVKKVFKAHMKGAADT